ncbi:DUF6266 family protein [Pedobacter faecalis]|uniref:DUF6266 family protein n=1 Tax=Pedobacter faecalis TaxID=3041495 RepID=UPI00254D380C|nr:DUF6266 family protein [Pedobacter sp. ELA7]
MARLTQGVFGGATGVAGDYECYIRNGIPYLRAKRRKTKKPATEPVRATRGAMSVVNRFVDTMTDFVRVGFELTARGEPFSANNAAKSYQLLHAVTGVYPDLRIDYPKVRLTQGSLPMPSGLGAERTLQGVAFYWWPDPNAENVLKRSQTMLLVYCQALNRSAFQIGGAPRYKSADLLEIPREFSGHALQVYIGFVSDNRQQISNSVWLGELAP